jgi:hypothetical protein
MTNPRQILVLTTASLLAGCASATNPSPLTALPPANSSAQVTSALAEGSATPAPDLAAMLATLGNSPSLKGTPTEVYERVARGALVCWFGANGPLKKTHIFDATAASPTKGGEAEITVHERDPTQPSPRGTRVFRIWLVPESSASTRMTMQVSRLPADLAQAMEKDTLAWGIGREACETQRVRPPPVPVAEPVQAKTKTRVKTTAR